ncbi:MAG: tail fiber domain-containing protein [Crocinitomicaceae bacterium TMED209]|nr:MAG: tail fiber domain-containing protein [Crocinitomicaceae bacterium TMED209]|tara:strand:- start:656 stop:2356 length:1701 start_codon:yes stop_codon:yes gene_type:complete
MAVNKNFVVKNGLEVSDGLIFADALEGRVGIGTTNPEDHLFHVFGGIGVTDAYVTGIATVADNLQVGPNGTALNVFAVPGIGNSVGIGNSTPEYLLDVRSSVSTGQTALYVYGDTRISGDLHVGDNVTFYETNATNINVSGISTLTNKLDIRSTDSEPGRIDFYCEVNNLHRVQLKAPRHSEFSGNPDVVLPNISGDLLVGNTSSPISQDLNTTGIVTASYFYGDGTYLDNVIRGIGIQTNSGPISYGATIIDFTGVGVSNTFDSNSGIGTISFEGTGGANVQVSSIAPLNPDLGDLWFHSEVGRTFIYYDETELGIGTDAFWVDASPISSSNDGVSGDLSNYNTATEVDIKIANANFTTPSEVDIKIANAIPTDSDTKITVSQNPPDTSSLEEGTLWWNSSVTDARLYVLYVDPDTGLKQWIEASPNTTILNSSVISGDTFRVGTGVTLYSSGDASFAGIATAQLFNSLSDIEFKENIQTVDSALDKVMSIRGVSFDWKDSKEQSFGVIAQELEQVLPELVYGESSKAVNYNGLVGILIESIKDMKQEIMSLNEEIQSLKQSINN